MSSDNPCDTSTFQPQISCSSYALNMAYVRILTLTLPDQEGNQELIRRETLRHGVEECNRMAETEM